LESAVGEPVSVLGKKLVRLGTGARYSRNRTDVVMMDALVAPAGSASTGFGTSGPVPSQEMVRLRETDAKIIRAPISEDGSAWRVVDGAYSIDGLRAIWRNERTKSIAHSLHRGDEASARVALPEADSLDLAAGETSATSSTGDGIAVAAQPRYGPDSQSSFVRERPWVLLRYAQGRWTSTPFPLLKGFSLMSLMFEQAGRVTLVTLKGGAEGTRLAIRYPDTGESVSARKDREYPLALPGMHGNLTGLATRDRAVVLQMSTIVGEKGASGQALLAYTLRDGELVSTDTVDIAPSIYRYELSHLGTEQLVAFAVMSDGEARMYVPPPSVTPAGGRWQSIVLPGRGHGDVPVIGRWDSTFWLYSSALPDGPRVPNESERVVRAFRLTCQIGG